jgi:hypothetical protein
MRSKTEIEKQISHEDGTPTTSLENARSIMFGGGYECDGIRIFMNSNMTPKWTVYVHFTHVDYKDVIEHRFTGFDLGNNKGARALHEFFKMFNIHPHFNPFQPKERYDWGSYSSVRRK